jgi:hypothetical protein
MADGDTRTTDHLQRGLLAWVVTAPAGDVVILLGRPAELRQMTRMGERISGHPSRQHGFGTDVTWLLAPVVAATRGALYGLNDVPVPPGRSPLELCHERTRRDRDAPAHWLHMGERRRRELATIGRCECGAVLTHIDNGHPPDVAQPQPVT